MLIKGNLIVMDISTVPEGWDLEKWAHITRETGMLFWDSQKYGELGVHKPMIVQTDYDPAVMRIKVIDLTTPEGREEYEKLPKYVRAR